MTWNLKSNKIDSIESKAFEKNTNLNELNLENNKIQFINSNTFYGINYLNILNLQNNSIEQFDKNSFNNSNPKLIILTGLNLSVDNVCNLKTSLKPRAIKSFTNREYFDSIYIENRNSLNCEQTFSFMKSKILYNFLDDTDLDNFFIHCNSVSKAKKVVSKYGCNELEVEATVIQHGEPFELNLNFLIIGIFVICLFMQNHYHNS